MDFTKATSEEKEQAVLSDRIKKSVNIMLVCKVVKVDLTKQRVDVQPCITDKIEDPMSKTFIYTRMGKLVPVIELEPPIIPDVPIQFARAGIFTITIPVAVGDYGMLIISHQDLSKWKEQGGTGVPQQHLALLDINNGVFIPGVPNAVTALGDYSSTAMEFRAGNDKISMDGNGTITVTGSMTISGTLTGTTDVVANGKSLKAHTHPVTTAPGTTGVNN